MIEINENILMGVVIYLAVVAAAFWLAMILWTYRDMKARSRDALARILVGVFVALLTLPGLLIYLLLRPRETLAESYERSLEEEALLQEIEEKPVCPTCGIRTQADWQVCPSCHTRLKKGCINCGQLLELSWSICPYCSAGQVTQDVGTWSSSRQPHVHRSRPETQTQYAPEPSPPPAEEPLQYIEGDEY